MSANVKKPSAPTHWGWEGCCATPVTLSSRLVSGALEHTPQTQMSVPSRQTLGLVLGDNPRVTWSRP